MLIWPIPASVQLVSQTADSVVFLAECAVLTLAVGLDAREAAGGRRLGSVGRSWLNAAMQFAGTLAALASINAGSAFGALCFVIGVVLLWRHQLQRGRPPVPKEV